MLESQAKQFSLHDDGRIFWQKNATNPLPGEPVAYLVKGKELLRPEVELLKDGVITTYDSQAVKKVLESWLKAHIEDVLAPLVALRDDENMTPTARGIAFQLYEALGVIPRGRLMELISVLDQDGRRDLRQKRVKLGPVLVFLPMLNKPASVRLRAVLWSLYNDRALPAPVPADGVVSVSIEGQDKVDFSFYQSISYPVYGNKAIRIDMLDRVINAIYETAQEGKFQARHDMAEWLGCSIADLYGILEAMGHKKIHDPADEQEKEVSKEVPEASPEEKTPEGPEEKIETPEPVKNDTGDEAQSKQEKAQKPELATFQLKKGQAHKRPFNKNNGKNNKKKEQNRRPHKKKGGKSPVVMSAPAKKVDDSPFAVLAQLKTEGKSD